RRRAPRGQEPARGDPPGVAPAIPADPDDDRRGAFRRAAAHARHGCRLGATPPAWPHHGRRPDRQPGADALHYAGDLSLLRPLRAPLPAPRRGTRRVNLSAPFVARPVATTLLAIGVVLAGVVAFTQLPVSPLPQVDYPTISVQASLPGANPETMASTVATPLERALGRIAGVTEITSSSSLGSSRITLQFDLSRNINDAATEVQSAINAARSQLPSGMPNNPTYRKVNPADAPIMVLTLTSDTLPRGQMYDWASTVVAQKISQVRGVGQVTVGGSALPAVRAELNPTALNAYGIALSDVRTALANANA